MFLDKSDRVRLFSPPGPLGGAQWAGLRVGLLGGSFNPPHAGHFHIAKIAMQKFHLDAVWWLVSPGNPIKETDDLLPQEERMRLVRRRAAHPSFIPSTIESVLGTRRTFDTVRILKKRFPRTQFLWICGMDNALIFHRWHRWREMAGAVPFVFIARPPLVTSVRSCPIRMLSHGKKDVSWLLEVPGVDLSSTGLRRAEKGGVH